MVQYDQQIKHMNNKINEIKLQVCAMKGAHDKREVERDDVVAILNLWREEFPHMTIDALIEHAKAIGIHAVNYYEKLYNMETGDLLQNKENDRRS